MRNYWLALILALAIVLPGCTIGVSEETVLRPFTVLEYLDDWKGLDEQIQALARRLYGFEQDSEELDSWLLAYYHSQAYLTALEMGDLEWADLNYEASEKWVAELEEMLPESDPVMPGNFFNPSKAKQRDI